MQLKGLPEGVELVEIVTERGNDSNLGVFVWYNGHVTWGARVSGSLVVRSSPGYGFKYDVVNDYYVPVKAFAKPLTLTAEFRVTNESDAAGVRSWAMKMPGFTTITEQ